MYKQIKTKEKIKLGNFMEATPVATTDYFEKYKKNS